MTGHDAATTQKEQTLDTVAPFCYAQALRLLFIETTASIQGGDTQQIDYPEEQLVTELLFWWPQIGTWITAPGTDYVE